MFKNDLFEVFQSVVASNILPNSFHKAVITLIPKKGDLCDISNVRPVSLLNTDYKLLAKLLANRLKQFIGTVVHEDQSYCVPERTIYYNLNLIRDLLNYCNYNDLPLAVVNLDQKKSIRQR